MNTGTEAAIPATAIPAAVYADVSGVVTQVNADEGVFSQPAAALIVISDINSVQIDAQVDESEISKVCAGQSADVSGDGFEKIYGAKITQVYPTARTVLTDAGKKTVVDILLSIDKADSSLLPGLNAQVKINVSQNKKAILLPYSAVGEDNANIMYVYVMKNGRAVRKNITVGSEYSDTVEITGGIQQGDTVIAEQSRISKNGIPVRLKNA